MLPSSPSVDFLSSLYADHLRVVCFFALSSPSSRTFYVMAELSLTFLFRQESKQRIRLGAFLLRCPVCALASLRLRCTPTAVTRSGRCIRPRRRSHRSPSRHASPEICKMFQLVKIAFCQFENQLAMTRLWGSLKKEGRRPSLTVLFVFADNLFLPGFFSAVRATHFSCSAHMRC